MRKELFIGIVSLFLFVSNSGFAVPQIASKESLNSDFIKEKIKSIQYEDIKNGKKLDLYYPNEKKEKYPLIIIVHGGGFRYGDKEDKMNQATLEAVKHGYAVAIIDYTLSGEGKFPRAIEDVKASIRFLRKNSKKYKLDPDKFGLWGASAGGNLVALAGTTGNDTIFSNKALGNIGVSEKVQAVVDWFGPINFLTMDNQFEALGVDGQKHNTEDSFESQYMGEQITKIPDLVQKSNPENYIDRETPPFLIEHGTGDTLVPYLQSKHFAEQLALKGGKDKVTLVYLKGAEHGEPKAFESKENLDLVFKFFDKYLK